MPRCIVSKALLISSSNRLISYPFDVMAFSARVLKVNTSSVVLLPALYAVCVTGSIFLSIFPLILVIIHNYYGVYFSYMLIIKDLIGLLDFLVGHFLNFSRFL